MKNYVEIIGRLGKDVELKYVGQNNKAVCNLSIATERTWFDKQTKQKQSQTEWHNVALWDKDAENASKYLSKGDLVLVEGRLQTQKSKDKQGNDKYDLRIVSESVRYLQTKGKKSEEDFVNQMADNSLDNVPF